MKKRRTRLNNGVEIPITPLIDIVFLLLIYFLLTSHFVSQQTIKVDLPKSRERAQSINQKILTLSLTREGKIFLEGREVTKKDLKEKLLRYQKRGIEKVIIEADKNARIQLLVDVMDMVKASGIKQIMLKTILVGGAS